MKCFAVFTNLDNVNKDVDGGIDSQHEMVPPGQDLCPGRPDQQLPVVDHLVSLIDVGDQLGGVAAEEHHHYGGEQRGHGGVTAMVSSSRYGVVEQGGSGVRQLKLNRTMTNEKLYYLLIPLNMRKLRTERRMTGMRLITRKFPNWKKTLEIKGNLIKANNILSQICGTDNKISKPKLKRCQSARLPAGLS